MYAPQRILYILLMEETGHIYILCSFHVSNIFPWKYAPQNKFKKGHIIKR